MKPFKWMFEEQNATEIEYKGKQVSALYRYDKRENIWMAVRRRHMKFTNTYRYVVLKQVMFLILFLIILVCMIKIDLEYLKKEVLIVFAFVIYFAIKIGLFFIDRLCGVQKARSSWPLTNTNNYAIYRSGRKITS